jgi:hypothetical protein
MLRWKQLVNETDACLSARDNAEVNLACAEGLPGSELIKHDECIDRLNHYARSTAHYTERRMPEFRKRPEVYAGSEAIFRIVCMITLLQREFGIRNNPAKRPTDARLDAADVFIHGALVGDGGTCASLPVVYTAVGRRLGYPLKLVACRSHRFARWDQPGGERFNIEVNDKGTDTPLDDYYRQGEYAVTAQEEKDFCFLRSCTPRMELADFLAQRGHLWLDLCKYREATESFLWSSALVPANKLLSFCAKQTMEAWRKKLKDLRPPNCPEFNIHFPPTRRFPSTIPLGVEHYQMVFEATESWLADPIREREWWAPLRRGVRPPNLPARLEFTVDV